MVRLGFGSLIEKGKEIDGKRKQAGTRFNSEFDESVTYKGQPLIILEASSYQACVFISITNIQELRGNQFHPLLQKI